MSVITKGLGGWLIIGGLSSAAAAPSPAVAEEAPIAIRIQTTHVPIVYRDILLGWMEPWQGRVLESRKKWATKATVPCFQVSIFDRVRMAEEMRCRVQLLKATNREIFKAKELLIGQGVLSTAMPDRLRFGEERCLLIDQMDRWFGV